MINVRTLIHVVRKTIIDIHCIIVIVRFLVVELIQQYTIDIIVNILININVGYKCR